MVITVMHESFTLKMVGVWVAVGAVVLLTLPLLVMAFRGGWRKGTREAFKALAGIATIASVFLLIVLGIGWFATRSSCGDFDEVEVKGSAVVFRHTFTGALVTRPLADVLEMDIREGNDDGHYYYGSVRLRGGEELVTDWTSVQRRRLERDMATLRAALWPDAPPKAPSKP